MPSVATEQLARALVLRPSILVAEQLQKLFLTMA